MARVGAKPKCSKEVIARAVQLKRGGANNVDIAAAIDISETTFYAWCNQPKTPLQTEFSENIKKAEADYKNSLLESIKTAGEKDWKANAWLLERKYPAEYARVDRLQAEVKQETTAAVAVTHFFDYGEDSENE